MDPRVADRQATPVGVSELDPLLTKLAPQDAILRAPAAPDDPTSQ